MLFRSPDPPFICYLSPGDGNFSADGVPYFKVDSWAVELYTDYKDPPTERRVEDALEANGIYYTRAEVWIESEKLYEVRYAFELVSDAEKEADNE